MSAQPAITPDPSHALILGFLREQGIAPDAPHFQLLSGGNSHITWRVGDLVVKVAQPDGPLAPYDIAHEAEMMRVAKGLGAAAPEVLGHHVSTDGSCDFLVMRLVEGDSPPLWKAAEWLASGGPGFRLEVGRSLLRALRPLRTLSVPHPGGLADYYRYYLADAEQRVTAAAEGVLRLPAVVPMAGRWLRESCDQLTGAFALHHGDFRLGNTVFDGSEIAALLDWERAMPGHPMHDVGYLCLPGMKAGELLGGVLTEAELARAWTEEMGEPFDLQLCAWFKIVAMYTEFCTMVRALVRQGRGQGRITAARTLPLVAQLHLDLVVAIQEYERGRFHL